MSGMAALRPVQGHRGPAVPTFASRDPAEDAIASHEAECQDAGRQLEFLTQAGIQPKLRIGAPGDAAEREADAAADSVMRMADPRISVTEPAKLSRKCAECEEEDEKPPLRRKGSGDGRAGAAAPPIVNRVLASPGRPLDPATRSFMAERFGADFSGVRIHTDAQAAQSAAAVEARAYTVGRNIVFGSGEFDPASQDGQRLLAHELAHTLQQDCGAQALQRQDKPKVVDDKRDKGDVKKDETVEKKEEKKDEPAKPDPATAYYHIVVRDPAIDLGGGMLVNDLAAAKATLMQRKIDKPWTLVLSIHASENRLGAQIPDSPQKTDVFYDANDVSKLFGGDSAFVKWRDQYGPTNFALYGCQVTKSFEQTIADNLVRGGKAPSAAGLGEGCKPSSVAAIFYDAKDKEVKSRAQYDKLPDSEKESILNLAKGVNSKWGYYGGPPVPDGEVLDYLFKGPKPGRWPRVEVIVKKGDDYVSANPPIPYWNRSSNHQYLQTCTKAVGTLREHKPVAPGE